ncbi:MAG: response regulator [Candidatus Omnitrophica bacterium]|nr:response regulator [Candidatus Omnitrophota bacterium]
MEKDKILVVDDEEIIRQLLVRTFKEGPYHVEAVPDAEAALKKIKGDSFNLLITDLKMPRVSGMDILKEVKSVNPYIEVIIITGYPTIELAVEAVKIGAFDFICKPFDLAGMKTTVTKCLEKQKFSINSVKLGELGTLFEISKTISINTDIKSLLARILDSALEIVKAGKGSILLLDENTGELTVRAARGSGEEIMNNTGPFLSIPLVSKYSGAPGNALGVINITDKISRESFTGREETLLSVLAGQAAVAIENANIYSQLQGKILTLGQTIDRLNQTQNQLFQSEKMAAVGQLAFGIAHEIRNPLGIILGGIEFLEMNLGNKDEINKEIVGKLKESIDRANNIIVDLLKFSRTSKLEAYSVNICALIDEVAALIKNQAYSKDVRIVKNYADSALSVLADPALLRQAFFNLCINAIDSMSKGGELRLNIYSGQGQGAKANKEVIVEIADTGKGIPEDILPRIFEPFFTTKEPGKGTGLGLSIVHLILERHKAAITVESAAGKGTKFTIRLLSSLPADLLSKGGRYDRKKEDTLN